MYPGQTRSSPAYIQINVKIIRESPNLSIGHQGMRESVSPAPDNLIVPMSIESRPTLPVTLTHEPTA
jgi:hypothetical protein